MDPTVPGASMRLDPLAALQAGFALLLAVGMLDAAADDAVVTFDAEALRQRGIDPRLAEYFSAAAKFTPGVHRVKLKVNGMAKGNHAVRIDDQGVLCFDRELLAKAGLLDPAAQGATPGCETFMQRYTLTQVDLRPDVGEVDINVVDEALQVKPRDPGEFSRGGVAGILNYELLGMGNRFDSGSSRSASARTELGFNAGDWIVRSRQLYNNSNGQSQRQHVDAYAQRTFADLGAVLQLGQINLRNPVLGGAQVTGIQVANEHGLATQGVQAQVEGLAQGPARVEVRQQGTLIYTTIVPGGPFLLTDVPRINQRAALDVSVIEADGATREFSVSAAQAGVVAARSGYVAGVGTLRNAQDTAQTTVASAGWTAGLGRQGDFSLGAMVANAYTSIGTSVGHQPWEGAQVRADLVAADASEHGTQGRQSRLSFNQRMGAAWGVNASVTQQSVGYRDLLDSPRIWAEQGNSGRLRNQWDAGMSWSHAWLGSFTASYSEAAHFDSRKTRRASASWSKSLNGVSLSVTAERDLTPQRQLDADGHRFNGGTGNALYASVSMPLGERKRLRTTYNDSNGRERLGASFSDSPSDTFNYRVGADRNLTTGTEGFTGNVSMLPRYAQVDLGYSGDGAQQSSISAGIRGGLVAHSGGVTPSAYAVGDTFGVVKVGAQRGIKLNTSAGPVWTDGSGHAVVPHLSAYGRSSVEVAAASLPRNVDVTDGVRQVRAGRGAVEQIELGVEMTRRVLLNATLASGERLPAGASVVDEQDYPVGLVDQDGAIFLANAVNLKRLWVSSPHVPRCELQFELAEEPDVDAFYESVPAVCRTS